MVDLKQITELFDKYGTKTAFLILLSFLIIILFKSKVLGEVIKNFTDKWIGKLFNKNKAIDTTSVKILFKESDLINHEIFNYIDFWLYSSIPTLKFKTEYRTVVFRKYLSVYFNQYKDSLFLFINSGEYKELDNNKLKSTLYTLFNDIVTKYENSMRQAGIPDAVISKMKTKNNETYQLLLELVNSVCDNHFYDTDKNMLKIFTILNILNATLEYTINISSEVCNNINGELSGKQFDGVIEPNKHEHLLDIKEAKNDFIHIWINDDGILIIKILDDVIIDDQNISDYITLAKSVNGDVKRLILLDASSDWNITDKGLKLLKIEDKSDMAIARAILVKTENQKYILMSVLNDDVPIKAFNIIDDAFEWLKKFK